MWHYIAAHSCEPIFQRDVAIPTSAGPLLQPAPRGATALYSLSTSSLMFPR